VVEAREETGSQEKARAAVHDQVHDPQEEVALAQTHVAAAPDVPERSVEMMNHVHHARKRLVVHKSRGDKPFGNYFLPSVAKCKRSGSHLNSKAMRLSTTLLVLLARIVSRCHMLRAGVLKPPPGQKLLRECWHEQQKFQRLTSPGSLSVARVLHRSWLLLMV
jgi:hypothetical protein